MKIIKEADYEITKILGKIPDCDADTITFIIKNFVRFVGLLPASKFHHHQDSMGLFMHSLEVAVNAVSDPQCELYINKFPPYDREQASMVIFICALLHDIGKISTDISVFSEDRKKQWNPLVDNSLHDWAIKEEVTNYVWDFDKNSKHNAHQKNASNLFGKILGNDLQGNFRSLHSELNNDLFGYMLGEHINVLSEIVLAADRLSVAEYLRRFPYFTLIDQSSGQRQPSRLDRVPVLREISHIIKQATLPLSGVYHLELGIFVDISELFDEIIIVNKELCGPGVPQTKALLAKSLEEWGCVAIFQADKLFHPIRLPGENVKFLLKIRRTYLLPEAQNIPMLKGAVIEGNITQQKLDSPQLENSSSNSIQEVINKLLDMINNGEGRWVGKMNYDENNVKITINNFNRLCAENNQLNRVDLKLALEKSGFIFSRDHMVYRLQK